MKATYLKMDGPSFDEIDPDDLWQVNKNFVADQVENFATKGKRILLSSDPDLAEKGTWFFKEVDMFKQANLQFEKRGDFWEVVY